MCQADTCGKDFRRGEESKYEIKRGKTIFSELTSDPFSE